jgi:hypothetical protein
LGFLKKIKEANKQIDTRVYELLGFPAQIHIIESERGK